jgi:hypothetical protein
MRNVLMNVEAMEADKGRMKVPMAVGGAVKIVPNGTGMKVPMAIQAM